MHPERNSSLILRAEILSDGAPLNVPPSVHIPGYTAIRNITRRILPRLPQRDRALDQDCTYYAVAGSASAHDECDSVDEDVSRASLVVLTPRLDDGARDLPWYHPPVRHLAFRYIQDVGGANLPVIRVEIVPLHPEDSSASGVAPSAVVADPASRLYRTCLSLLETVWKYGKGMMTGYKKRVVHDVRARVTISFADLNTRSFFSDLFSLDSGTERSVPRLVPHHEGAIQRYCRRMA
jgi:tRNASer (uridine44-2'-O)-methyltransferase